MVLHMLDKLYSYRTSLPYGRSFDTLWSDLCEQVGDMAYKPTLEQTDETGERVVILRPMHRLGWYHNSFRPVIALSLQGDSLMIRCTLTKVIRRFICVLSCFLLLLQVAFLFITQPSWTWFLPLGMLFFLHLMSITGLRLTSDCLIKDLSADVKASKNS